VGSRARNRLIEIDDFSIRYRMAILIVSPRPMAPSNGVVFTVGPGRKASISICASVRGCCWVNAARCLPRTERARIIMQRNARRTFVSGLGLLMLLVGYATRAEAAPPAGSTWHHLERRVRWHDRRFHEMELLASRPDAQRGRERSGCARRVDRRIRR